MAVIQGVTAIFVFEKWSVGKMILPAQRVSQLPSPQNSGRNLEFEDTRCQPFASTCCGCASALDERYAMSIVVREATPADIDGAIDALVDGFSKDPVMSGAMGGTMKTERIRKLFEFQIRTQFSKPDQGRVDVAIDENGRVLGAALWATPNKSTSFLDELRHAPEYVRVLGSSLVSAALTEYKLLKARPVFKHWYLYTIGVHAEARGHGVGSALLDFRREQLGEYPAYLEASTYNSAALYKRHGFVEMGGYGKLSKAAIGMWHPAPVSTIDAHRPQR